MRDAGIAILRDLPTLLKFRSNHLTHEAWPAIAPAGSLDARRAAHDAEVVLERARERQHHWRHTLATAEKELRRFKERVRRDLKSLRDTDPNAQGLIAQA